MMMTSFEELPPHLQQRKQTQKMTFEVLKTQKGHHKPTFNGTYDGRVLTR
jgi:hypothetical protein